MRYSNIHQGKSLIEWTGKSQNLTAVQVIGSSSEDQKYIGHDVHFIVSLSVPLLEASPSQSGNDQNYPL